MNQKTNEIFWGIGLFSIFLIGLAFPKIEDKFVLLLLAVNCFFQYLLSKKLAVDPESLLLFAGMLIYGIIGKGENNFFWNIKVVLLPFLFYLYGKSVISLSNRQECQHRTNALIVALNTGLLIASMLNAVNWVTDRLVYGRSWREFWTDVVKPATQHVFYNVITVALIFYGIYCWKKNKLLSLFLIAGGIWSLWFSLISGSRTLIAIFVLVFGLNILLFYCLNRANHKIRKSMHILFLILLGICALAGFCYIFNIGGFSDYMKSPMWARDGGILHNVRFEIQWKAITQLFKYPMGGSQMELSRWNHTHNVWLDIANRSGLIPFCLIVAYTIATIYNLIKLLIKQTVPQAMKYLLMSSYLSLFLYYMIEPALEANIIYWSVWALICGLIKGVLQNQNFSTNSDKEDTLTAPDTNATAI